jgi:hypothetical protein
MVPQQTQWQYWWRGASPPSLFLPSSLHIRSGIEEYRRSYGISTDTVAILVERGFTSLSLLDHPPSTSDQVYGEVLQVLLLYLPTKAVAARM